MEGNPMPDLCRRPMSLGRHCGEGGRTAYLFPYDIAYLAHPYNLAQYTYILAECFSCAYANAKLLPV